MRQINRRTGRLSGNYKRHLKKVGRWNHERSKPRGKGWVGQRKSVRTIGGEELEPIPGTQGTTFRPKDKDDILELVDEKEIICVPDYAKCLACESPESCEHGENS